MVEILYFSYHASMWHLFILKALEMGLLRFSEGKLEVTFTRHLHLKMLPLQIVAFSDG